MKETPLTFLVIFTLCRPLSRPLMMAAMACSLLLTVMCCAACFTAGMVFAEAKLSPEHGDVIVIIARGKNELFFITGKDDLEQRQVKKGKSVASRKLCMAALSLAKYRT